MKKEGKVLELDDTWRMYFEQPRDVRMLLEDPDLINDAEEAQDLKDLDYIRNQLRYVFLCTRSLSHELFYFF